MRSGGKAIRRIDRRDVLKTMIGGVALANLEVASAETSSTGTSEGLLGGFEEGLDGWRTNGGNTLDRVHKSDLPPAVTSGSYALDVGISGDSYPMIERTEELDELDFRQQPYLTGDVVATPVEGVPHFSFQWRVHYDASNRPNDGGELSDLSQRGRGRGADSSGPKTGQRGNRGRPVLVETSPTMTVRPLTRSHLYWDLTDVETWKLSSVTKIQLLWHPSTSEPHEGARGKNKFEPEYEGRVILDSIRTTSDPTTYSTRKYDQDIFRLQKQHGMIQDTVIETSNPDYRAGKIVFSEGTRIAFTFTLVDDDKFELTIAEETYKLGPGWD